MKKEYSFTELNFPEWNLDDDAVRIVKKLNKQGFEAYIVGGAVRDSLVGITPKDFDIVTNAKPKQIARIFKRSMIIGRRFQIVHIHIGKKIIEISTFRQYDDENSPSVIKKVMNKFVSSANHFKIDLSGMIMRDNKFGTLPEDAMKRDLTINALYCDPIKKIIIDFHDCISDFKNKQIKLIGDAEVRLREDPVRILRIIRFKEKLNFSTSKEINEAIKKNKILLEQVNKSRLFEEIKKIFSSSASYKIYHSLEQFSLIKHLFPVNYKLKYKNDFKNNDIIKKSYQSFIDNFLQDTDTRVKTNLTISPAFWYSVLLWFPLNQNLIHYSKNKKIKKEKLIEHFIKIINEQNQRTLISNKVSETIFKIWEFQFAINDDTNLDKISRNKHFNAIADFINLRAKSYDKQVTTLSKKIIEYRQKAIQHHNNKLFF